MLAAICFSNHDGQGHEISYRSSVRLGVGHFHSKQPFFDWFVIMGLMSRLTGAWIAFLRSLLTENYFVCAEMTLSPSERFFRKWFSRSDITGNHNAGQTHLPIPFSNLPGPSMCVTIPCTISYHLHPQVGRDSAGLSSGRWQWQAFTCRSHLQVGGVSFLHVLLPGTVDDVFSLVRGPEDVHFCVEMLGVFDVWCRCRITRFSVQLRPFHFRSVWSSTSLALMQHLMHFGLKPNFFFWPSLGNS